MVQTLLQLVLVNFVTGHFCPLAIVDQGLNSLSLCLAIPIHSATCALSVKKLLRAAERLSTWFNASEITLPKLMRLHTSSLLCKQLQAAGLESWSDPLPWTVLGCLYYLCAHRDAWEGRAGRAGAGVSASRPGAAVWSPGCVPALSRAPSPAFGRGHLDRVSSIRAGKLSTGAETRWSWGQQQSSGSGCCCDSDGKPCFSAERRDSDVAARCCVSTFVTGAMSQQSLLPAECLWILCWYPPWSF